MCERRMKSDREHRGLALVAVLWIVVVMTAIMAIVSQTSRLNAKMSVGTVDDARLKWACRAGIETAIAVLNEDTRDSDCLSDTWSSDDADFNNVQLERSAFSVRVTDEAGKLNVNTATREQLLGLPMMEPQAVDAILDWRDNDDNPGADGAEAGYYDNLKFPYPIRNGTLHTIRELLRVKGVTEQQLYGEDTNLNGQLDYNERDGELSPPLDNRDEILDQGWYAYLTCYSYENNVDSQGNTRVNINQASEQQLQSQLSLSSAQARWITQNRGSGFKTIFDLINDDSPKESSGDNNSNSNAGANDSPNPGNSGGNRGPGGNPGGGPPPPGGGGGGGGGGGNPNEPAQPLDVPTFRQIADKITISTQSRIPGRVNVNTAPTEVLAALFGGQDEGRQTALAIVAERSGRAYGFESLADLLSVQSVNLTKLKAVAEMLTVRSNVFMIRCTAAALSKARLDTECVVDRGASPCTILYWYQGAND
jgi:general secretion pathway protein K